MRRGTVWCARRFSLPNSRPVKRYRVRPETNRRTGKSRNEGQRRNNADTTGATVTPRTWTQPPPRCQTLRRGETVEKSRTGGQFRKECHKSLEERKPSVRVCSEGQGKIIVVVVLAVTRSFPQLPFPFFLLLTIFTFSLQHSHHSLNQNELHSPHLICETMRTV